MRPLLGCIPRRRPPNYQGLLYVLNYPMGVLTSPPRAYVVPKVKPQPGAESAAFSKEIQEWVQGRVASHKFLRGGVVIIDQVPKSAAGKILRRQLRDMAKAESDPKPKL